MLKPIHKVKLLHSLSLLMLSSLFSTSLLAQSEESSSKLIINANVVSMQDGQVLPNQRIRIDQGIITAVGSANELPLDAGQQLIDVAGAYVIPGLRDAHVHIQDSRELAVYLFYGVTGVRELDGSDWALNLQQQIQKQPSSSPRLLVSSPVINLTNDSNPEDIIQDFQVRGFSSLKIYSVPNKKIYQTFSAEARKQGLKLIGHIPRSIDLETLLDTGYQSEVAHLEEFIYSYVEKHKKDYSQQTIDEIVSLLKGRNITIITTLVQFQSMVEQLESVESQLAQPGLNKISPLATLSWTMDNYSHHLAPKLLPELKLQLAFLKKLVKALANAKIPLQLGTDSGVAIIVAGEAVHLEMALLVESGLTPLQALQAATRTLGAMNKQAIIAPGEKADLVFLLANPLQNIHNSRLINGVLRAGHWHSKVILEKQLSDLKLSFKPEHKFSQIAFNEGLEPALNYFTQINRNKQQLPNLAAYEFLIRGLLNIQSNDAAAVLAKATIKLYPDNYLSHFLLAMVAEAEHNHTAAIRAYQRVLKLDPDNNIVSLKLEKLTQRN